MKSDFCLAAGTLVHTKEGLQPIDTISVGDWVLSQPLETGEQAYKRVIGKTQVEQQAVVRVRCFSSAGGVKRSQTLIVTDKHPIYVAGHDTSHIGGNFDQDSTKPTGWCDAICLEYGAVLELAGRQSIKVSGADRVWRSRTPGVGWIGEQNSEVGHYIDLRHGQVQESTLSLDCADLAGVDDFNERYECDDQMDKWAFKCTVYNVEVEDFHTCYVGHLGVWVRSAS